VVDLERHGRLVRVREEVDPRLEMAAIHLRVHEKGGPALLFERVRGCRFRAVSNLFGTLDRARFLFRDTLARVQTLVELKYDPVRALRRPLGSLAIVPTAVRSSRCRRSIRKTSRAPV
jgi:4-hydroxy-3-polyprenylbenzoate decarboxylase